MSSPSSPESTTQQLRAALDLAESLKVENARLRGALQEAISLAEQWGSATAGNNYVLAPLKALVETVRSDFKGAESE